LCTSVVGTDFEISDSDSKQMGKMMHERKISVKHVSIPEFLIVWKSVWTFRLKYMCEPKRRFLSVFLINTELNTAVK